MSDGLSFKKLDLHVHTPASHDFKRRDETSPEEIVDEALRHGLDGIAVTDHNTGDWVDKVKRAATGTPLAVFPGVEVSCGGAGSGGIHIIALFDPSCGTTHVNNLLSQLGISPDNRGDETALCNKTPVQIFEVIREVGAVAVAAHANSSKGFLKEMRGQARLAAVRHPDLLAAEATDFDDSAKAERRRRVVDLLDGRDADYQRKLAVYQASDNPCPSGGHCVEGIGSRSSFFKMEQISLEGLRQCFIHPEARVRTVLEQSPCKRIVDLSISGTGFFGGQSISFNRGLNSIIGGKGVGKSLVVELIRFALEAPPVNSALLADHHSKLQACLDVGDIVRLRYELSDGTRFRIESAYVGEGAPPQRRCYNETAAKEYTGSVPDLLPVLAYSQTEIIKVAEDLDLQRNLLDLFIDAEHHLREITRLRRELASSDVTVASALEASAELGQVRIDLGTANERLRRVQGQLEHETLRAKEAADRKRAILDAGVRNLVRRRAVVVELHDEIKTRDSSEAHQEFEGDEHVERSVESLRASDARLLTALQTWLASTEETEEALSSNLHDWQAQHEEIEARYQSWLTSAGGDRATQEALRAELVSTLAELEGAEAELAYLSESVQELKDARGSLLDQLERAYEDLHEARRIKYEELTVNSLGRLKLRIDRGASTEAFEERLRELLSGKPTIPVPLRTSLAQAIGPRRLVDLVLSGDESAISEESNLSQGYASKVIEKLRAHGLEVVLSLQHDAPSVDVPTIEYQKAADVYAPLDSLSVGQKCSALLLLAFTDGEVPILVDQPEDALDVVSIWQDVSQRLIDSKDRRQFIVTTHNSSVAVASDSDQFIVVTADARKARVQCAGAIDSQEVRAAVLAHLEGGDQPYALRRDKYGSQGS